MTAVPNPVKQSGVVTPGHVPVWATDGVVQDAGPGTNGSITELGINNNGGIGLAINSLPLSDTAPTTQLGFSVSEDGQAVISVEGYGFDAPGSSLEFEIDGTAYAFPGSYVPSSVITQVPNIATLRGSTTVSLPNALAYVIGYYTGADGGEGNFWANSTDTTSADNGGTIIVDLSGRRWYRETGGEPYSVKWFGARGNGTTDDTASFLAAATALPNGGALEIPALTAAGASYLTSKGIPLNSNTAVIGHGAQSLMTASASSVSDGTWAALAFFVNAGGAYNGLTQVAHDITVDGVSFDATNFPNGAFHAIRFGQTTRTRVTNCKFNAVGDGVAHIGCVDTQVDTCFATNVTNCGYDHWGGSVNCSVVESTAYCAGALSYGILYTAQDTADTQTLIATGFTCIGNTVYNSQQAGIWVNVLGSTGTGDSTFQATIVGNRVTGPASANAAAGIKCSGQGGQHVITGNIVDGVNGTGAAITVSTEPPLPNGPDHCVISGNIISSCTSTLALLQVNANFPTISHNHFVGCVAPNLFYVTGSTPVIMGNTGSGYTAGKYNVAGATAVLLLDPDQAGGQFAIPGLLSAESYTGPVTTSTNQVRININDTGCGFVNQAVELMNVVPGTPASGATQLELLVNNTGGVSLQPVTLGAANSGGTGFRALVVPN